MKIFLSVVSQTKLRVLTFFTLIFLAMSYSATARDDEITRSFLQVIPIPEDPCLDFHVSLGILKTHNVTVLGENVVLYPAKDKPQFPMRSRPLVLIIDGNGFGASDYKPLASYLSRKGFNVAVVDRPSNNGPNPVDLAIGSIDAAFSQLKLSSDTPVAVVGHSVGGGLAIDTVLANHLSKTPYDIRSMVLLAPKVDNNTDTLLSASELSAAMIIYGSQDNDVAGINNKTTDAFSAYDRLGTEYSSTCHSEFCPYKPQMHKTMVYAHGANHAGIVSADITCQIGGCPSYKTYLSKANQFCIAKGYTRAMLEWTLYEDPAWKRMIMGRYTPNSINNILSSQVDTLGNPVGTPLRMGIQVSPKKRSLIENFEDSSWNIATQTDDVQIDLATEQEHAGGSLNIRHVTKHALIGWPSSNQWQFMAFTVPNIKRDTTHFNHLSMRIGQLGGLGNPAFENTPNSFSNILIGLRDKDGHINWEWSNSHVDILPFDIKPNGIPQSVMQTVKIPLTSFFNIDKKNIDAVFLAFPAGTQGTLLLDNIEWTDE